MERDRRREFNEKGNDQDQWNDLRGLCITD
jgi:hypothetical protein